MKSIPFKDLVSLKNVKMDDFFCDVQDFRKARTSLETVSGESSMG